MDGARWRLINLVLTTTTTTIWNAKGSDIKYVKGFRPVAELDHLILLHM
jgi:hypothetical protein